MLVVLIAVVILLLVLIILLKIKTKGPDIPLYPGAWPIIGHIPLILGDNIKLYETIGKISKTSIQNGRPICISFGVMKYYVFTDPDDCYAILNSSAEKLYPYSFAKSWLGEGLFTASPQKWQAKKKLLYPMFQQQNLNKFLTVFNKESRRLVGKLSEQVGKGAFDHEPSLLHMSLATICKTAMGSEEGQLAVNYQKVVDAIKLAMDNILFRFLRVWLHPQPIYKISSTKREIDKNVKIIGDFAEKLLQQRKSKLKQEPNVKENVTEDFSPFVDTIIKIAQGNKEFNDRDVIDEVNTLILTGYDTNSNTLMFALMLLGHHQDVQDKVYKELIEVIGDTDRDIDRYDLLKLVYTEATIKEVMRLYTIAPIIGRNVNTELKLKSCTVPTGTSCLISLYGLHRHPEWGVDAEVFNPDRWMNPETMPKNPNLYAPFGMGKRYCVGKTYAMMAMKTTLAHVIRNYHIKADMNKLVLQMMFLIKPALGHQISLESRKKID